MRTNLLSPSDSLRAPDRVPARAGLGASGLPLGRFVTMLAFVLFLPSTATSAETDSVNRQAQEEMDRAVEHFKAQRFEDALSALRRADSLVVVPVARFNIARCLEELGRADEAVAAFERYLAEPDSTPGASERARRSREAVARLEATSLGVVEITCSLAQAHAALMGPTPREGPCPMRASRVRPGSYRVTATAPGALPFQSTLVVVEGEVARLKVVFEVPPPFVPPASAAPEPRESDSPPPTVQKALEARAPWSKTAGLIALPAGAVALAGAGVFAVLGTRENDSILEGRLPNPEAMESAVENGRTYNKLAWGMAAAGVAGVSAGIVFLLLPDRDTTAALVPMAGGGAVVATGTFE